ncbi:MAG: hypothetical protein COA58_01550 [Bacteroidetes bacterium]|nr:MAG: hypothetical protein COA58_01550 [Bacteroidota bacterium]
MSNKSKDICWFTPHANHYHHYLMEKCAENNIVIDTIYFSRLISKYPWKTKFDGKSKILSKSFLGVDFKSAFKGYTNYKTIVVAGWGEPTMMVLLSIRALLNKSYYLYTDTPQRKSRVGIKQRLRKVWLDWIITSSQGIMTTGKPGISYFTDEDVNRDKLINFPFVTNLDFFKPLKKSNSNEIKHIFSSGRLDIDHKGYDVAISALSGLANYKYSIAGSGPDEGLIKHLIEENHLSDRFILMGWTELPDLVIQYQTCDIFLHPSNFDPFPNAVLEAMACGCLVIASDLAGSAKDRIVTGVNGFLFKAGSSEDLKSCLEKVLSLGDDELLSIQKSARNTAEEWGYTYHIQTLQNMILCNQ